MVHGIAGDSSQFCSLLDELDERGIAWRAPELPGHGGRWQDMRGITWRDWYRGVEENYEELAREFERVSVVGFSIGAILSIKLACNYDVSRLVLLNTPIYSFYHFVPGWLFLKVLGFFTKDIRTFAAPDCNGRRRIHKRIHVSTLATMLDLIERVKPDVSEVKSPCLIVHSRNDLASRAKSADYLLEHLGSAQKGVVWLKSRDHSILEGDTRHRVVGTVGRFLAGESLSRLRGT